MATTRNPRAQKAGYPRCGAFYLTALHPTLGREIQKTRPALIIQNDISNRLSEITIVAPITSTVRLPLNPVHVLLAAGAQTGLSLNSVAVLNQIRVVDRVRLIKQLGTVDEDAMARVEEAIKISLGLIRL